VIFVKDIDLWAKVTIKDDPDQAIVTVSELSSEEEVETTTEATEATPAATTEWASN
jgi:hypothetical protein